MEANKLPASIFFLACLNVLACAHQRSGSEKNLKVSAVKAVTAHAVVHPLEDTDDIVEYAELCKAELGITEDLPDLSCLNGIEVPIQVNQKPMDATIFAQLKNSGGRSGCDLAQWLDGQCWTYDLIQRVNVSADVEGVLNCRQKFYSNSLSPSQRKTAYTNALARNATAAERIKLFREIFDFDDLGLILRNKKTGKSCFFTFFGNWNNGNSYYGGWIPAPDKKIIPSRDEIYAQLPEPRPPSEYPENMWNRGPKGADNRRNMYFSPSITAKGNCAVCHNQGPFKHSPFIDQARDGQGRIVPSNGRDLPYLLVGKFLKSSVHRVVEIDTKPIEGQAQECTSCHRMNVGSAKRLDWALGIDVPMPSEFANQWPQKAWMPESHGSPSQNDFLATSGKHINALKCCMANPNAKGCRYRIIGPTIEATNHRLEETLRDDAWIDGAADSTTSCVE